MTKKVIQQLQELLTIARPNRTYRIMDVGMLLTRHSPEDVLALMKQLRKKYLKKLIEIIRKNKLNPEIIWLIIILLRICMAMEVIRKTQMEGAHEVKHETESGTTSSG
jgi:hypothetical protein